ncbi:MAG: enoyl-CoA hydratase/isomerase family protein [Betaproteobacteria bacterium]|nr:MAG: enoyl-CoA hydratase/isomerase family protein [Betaproteobacteria bacterium]
MFTLAQSAAPGVFQITLERPPANAMGDEEIAELAAMLEQARTLRDCAVLLFTGSGRFFSAGADIKLMRGATTGRLVELARTMQAAFDAIERFPHPTIAAINGIATGGGLELALACDLRFAAAEARLGLTEVRIGLIPGAGGTQRLTRIAGRAVASRMILGGEIIEGRVAAALGVVHETVAAADLQAHALAAARALAALPREALSAAKRCIALAPSATGYAAEIAETARLHATEETRAAIAAFLDRSR